MIIKQSSTDKTVAEPKKDLYVGHKRVKDSDIHIEHKVGNVIYRVYFDRAGVHIHSDSKHECKMTIEPDMICQKPTVRIKITAC